MKYPKPKLFKPSLEEQKSAAEKLTFLLSPSVGLVLSDGTIVKGRRESMFTEADKEGNGNALVFNADLSNKDEVGFASDLEAVAATKPASLQEFTTRLLEVQKIPKL